MESGAGRTALVALHWQNDIILPNGAFAAFFAGAVEQAGLIPHMAEVLPHLRQAGVLIVFVRVCYRPGYPDLIPNNGFFRLIQQTGALVDGSWGAEIVQPLTPQPEDIVVTSRRITGFPGTDLDIVLQANGVRRLLVCGVATNATVLGTVFEGVNAGYETFALADCCTAATPEMHEGALATMGIIAGVTTSAEVLGQAAV